MTAKGHFLLALAPALLIAGKFHSLDESYIFLGSAAVGSVLPDIDEPNSYIGKRLAFLSFPLKIIGIPHRTITHYLIFPLLIALTAFFTSGIVKISLFGLAFGILMHDVGDMLTKGGIKGFFFPFLRDKTIRLLPKDYAFYTNSVTEFMLIAVLFAADFYLFYKVLWWSL